MAEDDVREVAKKLMIEAGALGENEPFDEDFEEVLQEMIDRGLLEEHFELDPETGHYKRFVRMTRCLQ